METDNFKIVNDLKIAYDLIMLHIDDLKEYALTRFNGEEQGVKINTTMPMIGNDRIVFECGSSEGYGLVEVKYDEFKKYLNWKYSNGE